MKRAITAEFRKLGYQRSTYGILAAACALAIISPISLIATAQLPSQQLFLDLNTHDTMMTIMTSCTAGYLFALIIGIVISTGEFRHSTAVATYLAQPARRLVLLAKMCIAAFAGFVLQVIATLSGFVAGNLYALRYEHVAIAASDYLRILAGGTLVGFVLAVVGVAVGSLIRSQMVAVMVAILWLELVEGLLIVFADWLGKWSMRGAITSVLGIAMEGPEMSVRAEDMLGPWQSVGLLIGYGVVFALLALRTTMRRDVD